jgi:hypothetical protein
VSSEQKKPGLFDLTSCKFIRAATTSERYASYQASKSDGGTGAIIIDGKVCYVEVWEDDEEFIKKFKYGLIEID